MNPRLPYSIPLTAEEAEARLTMPTTGEGFIVNLFFVPPRERDAYEAKWREWAQGQPKHLYPRWFSEWGEYRRSGSIPHYVGRMR